MYRLLRQQIKRSSCPGGCVVLFYAALHKTPLLISQLHHVIELLVFVKLTLLLRSGILVLLVLRDEVVHVGLSLGELHLVHALTSVPVKECLAAEHGGELLGDSLEHLLDGSGVSE